MDYLYIHKTNLEWHNSIRISFRICEFTNNNGWFASIKGEHAIEQVPFQVGDDTLLLMYGADFDNFDKYLPVAQEIK